MEITKRVGCSFNTEMKLRPVFSLCGGRQKHMDLLLFAFMQQSHNSELSAPLVGYFQV